MKSILYGFIILCLTSVLLIGCGGSTGGDQTSGDDGTSTSDGGESDELYDWNDPEDLYETSPVKLRYNHDLTIDYSGGAGSMTIHWDVKGDVAAPVIQSAVESIVCNGEDSEGAAYKLQGSGTIDLTGTWDIDNDMMSCHCDIDSGIQATMRGIVHNKPNDNGCTSQTTNLQVDEKWYQSTSAECTCDAKKDEYIDDAMIMQAQWTLILNAIIPANTPKQTIPEGKSFEFPYPGDGMQIQESFEGQSGSGTYTWEYHSPTLDVTPDPDDLYEDPGGQPWWDDQDGTYGPPLDSITLNLATEWFDN